MSIILIKNKEVLAIPNLWRYVAKYIFDEANMTMEEVHKMQDSIVSWTKTLEIEQEKLAKIQAADVKFFGRKLTTEHKYSEEEINLQAMGKLLKQNDDRDPAILSLKETVKFHNLDYRKLPFFRFPEAYTEKDFHDGEQALEKSKLENPDDYK